MAEKEPSPPADATAMAVPDASPARTKKRRRAPSCACASPEACFACGRCLERHCVCGTPAQRRRLCRESRACNCRVGTRCQVCQGCQRSGAAADSSHCRCLAHQRHGRRLDDAKNAPCGCFARQDVPRRCHAGTVAPPQAAARRKEIARVRRRAGLPSARGLYAKKIVAPGVGVDEFGEDCVELSDDSAVECDILDKPTSAEELVDVMPASYIETSRPIIDSHEPQARLSWSHSQPYQQAMAAPPIRHAPDATVRPGKRADKQVTKALTDESASRALENAVFERDRDAALPSENLVDYLIFTASVKASRIPELIGSLDDTAATALGIVAEEYMKQLVVRSTVEPLCAATKRSVEAFTSTVLRDFDYAVYLQRCGLPTLAQLSNEQTEQVTNDLARLVLDEFVALQPPSGSHWIPPPDQVIANISEVVAHDMRVARTLPLQCAEATSTFDATRLHKLKALKLSQHTSKVTGQRVYKYEVSAGVGAKHHAKVVLDGFESRDAAEHSIQRIHRTLEQQDKRLCEIENPAPRSPPKVVENPIITELYEQLLSQVRQSRIAQASKEPVTSTDQATNLPNRGKKAPAPNQPSTVGSVQQ